MDRRLSMLLRVLVPTMLAACGTPDSNKPLLKSAPPFFESIQFQNRLDNRATLTEYQFRDAAEKAFEGAVPAGLRVARAVLTARLENADDQMQIFLAIQVQVVGTARSVETALQATAGAGRPVSEVVGKGLSDLCLAVKDLLHLIHASPKRQIEALASPELDMQLWAAFLLGESSAVDAVPPLCRMLGDPRDEAADAAADALKKIAAPTAVPLIIESIRRGNLRSEVRAIEVLGRIGGKEAEAYLEMTAVGHEIPEVRNLSQSLLDSLRKSSGR